MTRTRLLISLLSWVLLALPLSTTPAGASVGTDAPTLESRTFQVKYKSFEDAMLLVTDIVDREGSEWSEVNSQPKLKRITVRDVRRVVDLVAEALNSFDVPPRQVRIRMTLLLGTRGEESSETSTDEVFRSVVAELRQALRYTEYARLGSLDLIAQEGQNEPTAVTVSGGYTIEFLVSRVDSDRRLVQLSPLTLSRAARQGEGSDRLLSTTLNLTAGQQMVMGASSGPSSDKGLLLAISAQLLD